MSKRSNYNRNAQLIVVLLCALALKLFYSTASPNQLRWILAPTTVLVEFGSGTAFKFESHAGYISSDRSFIIAASCAGVNFLITSFLMLSLRTWWKHRLQTRSQNRTPNPTHNAAHHLSWRFIPFSLLFAYLATLVANTVRISTALRLHGLQQMPPEFSWLTPNQLHRFEGIFIYFGFLLLLFMLSEKMGLERTSKLPPHTSALHWERGRLARQHLQAQLRQSIFPLLIYYATTLGIPLANAAFRPATVATDFWEHSLFVLLTPLLLILPLAIFHFYRRFKAVLRSV